MTPELSRLAAAAPSSAVMDALGPQKRREFRANLERARKLSDLPRWQQTVIEAANTSRPPTANIFCPTGAGGGQDPTCGKGEGGSGGAAEGGGGGAQPAGKKLSDLIPHADKIAALARTKMLSLLARAKKGSITSMHAHTLAQAHYEDLAAANKAAFSSVYQGLKGNAVKHFGEAVLKTPEWKSVAAAFHGGIDKVNSELEGMAGAVQNVLAREKQGITPEWGRLRDAINDNNNTIVDKHHEAVGNIVTAYEALAGKHGRTTNEEARVNLYGALAANVFCPTGPGGGQDPGCGKEGGSATPQTGASTARNTILKAQAAGSLSESSEALLVRSLAQMSDREVSKLRKDAGLAPTLKRDGVEKMILGYLKAGNKLPGFYGEQPHSATDPKTEPKNIGTSELASLAKKAGIDQFNSMLVDYTGGLSNDINGYLRTGKWEKNPRSDMESVHDVKELVREMDKLTIASPGLPHDAVFHRYVARGVIPASGSEYTDKGFVSVSTDADAHAAFAARELGGHTAEFQSLKVIVPRGVKAIPVSGGGEAAYGYQHEMILPRGAKYRVHSNDGNHAVIELIHTHAQESIVKNVFCPTGPGGGQDPTCSPHGVGARGDGASGKDNGDGPGNSNPSPRKVSREQQMRSEKSARFIIDHAKDNKLTVGQLSTLAKHMSNMSVSQLRQMRQDYGVKLGGTNLKQDFADQLRQKLLDATDKNRGSQGQPQPTPQPQPQPSPQPQPAPPVTSTLPHPELDPARPGISIGGRNFAAPRTQAELSILSYTYNVLKRADQKAVLVHFGIPHSAVLPDQVTFRDVIHARILKNLNPVPIKDQLANSPHAEAVRKIAEMGGSAADPQAHLSTLNAEYVSLNRQWLGSQRKFGSASNTSERAAARAERDKIEAQIQDVKEKMAAATREIQKIGTTGSSPDDDALTLIHAELQKFGATHKLDAASFPGNGKLGKYTNEGIEAARKFLDGKIVQRPGDPALEPVITTLPAIGDRSNYSPWGSKKEIRLDTDVGSATSVHEFGHHIEEVVPGVHEATLAFLDHRVGSEKPVKLKDVIPDSKFKDDELGRKDDFEKSMSTRYAYYTGKDYKGRFTEIVSMGVQKMYEDPVNFAKKDPEFATFILGVLSGQHRYNSLPRK